MNSLVVFEFTKAICEHDLEKIESLLSDDHKLVDAQGSVIKSKENVIVAWAQKFEHFPDYQVDVIDVLANGDVVAIFGFTIGAAVGQKHKKVPAAWKAEVRNRKIAHWQLYSDTSHIKD